MKVVWQKATSLSFCRYRLSYVMSCHGRHLGFDRTGNSTIRPADLQKTLPIEPNLK